MEQLALEIGRAIRRARLDRGMTLKELADSSAGRFRPTSLAGYERGERTISVVRFCELCRLLDVPPGRLLQEITRTIYGHGEPTIDLTKPPTTYVQAPKRNFLVLGNPTYCASATLTIPNDPKLKIAAKLFDIAGNASDAREVTVDTTKPETQP